MTSRIAAGACWLSLILLFSPVPASASQETDLPARWQVQADGWSGTLVLSIDPSGTISGTLQDRAVTGFLAGRRLVLHRATGDRTEVWDGWLPEASSSAGLFLAGSVTLGGPDGSRIHPWYAVPETDAAPAVAQEPAADAGDPVPAPEPAPLVTTGVAAAATEAPPAAEPTAKAPEADRSPSSEPEPEGLSGIWLDYDNRIEIIQKGQNLSVLMPDGTRHEGRYTASDTFVVGLRRGCCKGQLERPDRIRWSDGTIWTRTD